jgi:hypothetical protein
MDREGPRAAEPQKGSNTHGPLDAALLGDKSPKRQ